MKRKPLEVYRARARVAKAMAHLTRMLLLDLLQNGELNVQQLTSLVEGEQSTISKHLAVLRDAGLVTMRRAGSTHHYRVACGCLDGFFACFETTLREDLARRQASLDARPC